MSSRLLSGMLALGAGAVLVGAVLPAPPAPGRGGYRNEQVSAAQVICAPMATGSTGLVAGSDLGGGAGTTTLTVAGKAIGTQAPGTQFGLSSVTGPIVISAAGSGAPGLAVARAQLINAPGRVGYLLQPCPTPSASTWFVGAHSSVGRSTVIEVVNPDAAPAQFAIDVYGPGGLVDSPNSHGLVIAGYAARNILLTDYAPDLPIAAVSVTATSGRIAATAYDYSSSGLSSLGLTALAPTAPGTRLVLPGIPAGVTRATLLLLPLASGTAQATLLTGSSTFVPVGGSGIGLNAASLTQIDLTRGLGGSAAAVRIDSSVPVLAAVRYEFAAQITRRPVSGRQTVLTVTTTTSTAGEVVPAPALDATAVLPGISWDAQTTVFVSSLGSAGSVSLAAWPLGATAPMPAQLVKVPANRQVSIQLSAGRSGWWALVAVPGPGGPVGVSVLSIRSAAGTPSPSSVELSPLRQTLRLPAASFDVGLSRP